MFDKIPNKIYNTCIIIPTLEFVPTHSCRGVKAKERGKGNEKARKNRYCNERCKQRLSQNKF